MNKTKSKVSVKKEIRLEDLKFPPFEELKTKILKKLGNPPKLPSDLPKGNWSDQSIQVLEERYLRRDDEGKLIETPEGMCWRVAWEVASAEVTWGKSKKEIIALARDYYQILCSKEFLPNSPTLMNAGVGNNMQYSGCFVIPIADSLVGIFDALKYQALIHQTGGGTGFSFSRLRPRGSIVKSSHGVASGPVSFMRVFDAATNEIKQGGKRRGANMGIVRIDHPDIWEFIHCKEEGGITNFNISVGVTDEFMKAYEKNTTYDLINPKTGDKIESLEAVKVFDEIANLAWKTGDPGLIFLDRINRGSSNPVPSLGPIESTNPCGEQPLYPFDSCNLGSIFLTYFVKEEKGKKEVDWEKLGQTIKMAVRFLDDVIEVNPYTLPEIRQMTLAVRRIGLGVGGWADMLTKLGIAYNSQEAIDLAEKIMKTVSDASTEETISLAKERGSFPLWPVSIYKDGAKRRNSSLTTIAPTGSISIIAGVSSGIEPLFALAYQHIVKDASLDRKLSFINPDFVNQAKEKGIWSDELKAKIEKEGTVKNIPEVSEDLKKVFVTAHEIEPEWHVKTQVAFQKYTESAVSKTINLKHDATVDDVKQAYLMSWFLGCKGITIFRDGSKSAQVLNIGMSGDKANHEESHTNGVIKVSELNSQAITEPVIKRPFEMKGSTYKLQTPVGSAFITINEEAGTGMPMEVFINVGKAGSDVAAMAEALGRTISTALRFAGQVNPKERAREIAHQLSGIGGRRTVGFGHNKIRSLPDAVSVALSKHYGFNINGNLHYLETTPGVVGAIAAANGSASPKNGVELTPAGIVDPTAASTMPEVVSGGKEPNFPQEEMVDMEQMGDICPSCGLSSFVYQEGCAKCYSCGYSEC